MSTCQHCFASGLISWLLLFGIVIASRGVDASSSKNTVFLFFLGIVIIYKICYNVVPTNQLSGFSLVYTCRMRWLPFTPHGGLAGAVPGSYTVHPFQSKIYPIPNLSGKIPLLD